MEQPIDILIEGLKQFIGNYEYLKERNIHLYEQNEELLEKQREIREFLKEVKGIGLFTTDKDGNDIFYPRYSFRYKDKEIII